MSESQSASDRDAIEAACCRLVRAFCYFSDTNDELRYAALFTPDARFSRPDGEIVSATAIGAALRDRPANARVRHLCMDPVIDVIDASHASGGGTLIVARFDASSGVADPPLWGDFRDQYVLFDGEWRIALREVSLAFATP
jgi:hypothetical protein